MADFSRGELNIGLPVEFIVSENMPVWKNQEDNYLLPSEAGFSSQLNVFTYMLLRQSLRTLRKSRSYFEILGVI